MKTSNYYSKIIRIYKISEIQSISKFSIKYLIKFVFIARKLLKLVSTDSSRSINLSTLNFEKSL